MDDILLYTSSKIIRRGKEMNTTKVKIMITSTEEGVRLWLEST